MARGRKIASPESRKRAQTAARESRQRLENQFREDTRDKFFKGNENISDDRLDRRRQQDLAEQRFIRTRMKPVGNTGGTLLQKRDPLGMSLEDFRMQNAMKYGPTLSEIGSDIGYGLSSIAKSFAEKGTPMIQLFKGLSDKFKGGVESAWDKVRGETTSMQGTAFPQPGSDTKDYFNAIDTGIAEVTPNNMLVDIAKQDQRTYEPFRVSDMNMSNVVAQNNGLPSLLDMYNFATNPQLNTNYGNFRLDNVLSGDPTLGYQTDMFGGQLGLTAQPNQFGFTFQRAFNKGGPVNKHGGLGYMFK